MPSIPCPVSPVLAHGRARTFHTAEGQGLVEYALILLLISLVALAAMEVFGVSIDGMYQNANGDFGEAVR